MSNLQKLEECFRSVLELSKSEKVESLKYQEHASWDSVAHMRLISELETVFDIMMETDQILDMSDYSKAKEILESHDINFS